MWIWLILFVFALFSGVEIWVLLEIGGLLGVGWTLIWVALSCLMGVLMIRMAGLRTLIRIHHRLRAEEIPTRELLDMGMILAGGFMLVLPGFITDAAGVLLMLPPVRWMLRRSLALAYGNMAAEAVRNGGFPRPGEEVVEIKAEKIN